MDLVSIDPASPVPPYEQLRAGVVEAVRSGALAAGDRLPPVRRLADDLGLAAGTVARAYRELEAGGAIETRGRAGSFVRPQADMTEQHARAAARAFVATVRELGLDDAQVRDLVRSELGDDSL